MEWFGRYVLLERVALGGMGEVFRAAALGSAGFSKAVAIKRILPHLAADAAFVRMLVDEAKIASTLEHPNIIQVLDLGEHQGAYFIAMEYVAGQSLSSILAAARKRGEKLPLGFAVNVVEQALRGLEHAHSRVDALGAPASVIHRDVSPQNVMVGYNGVVKLADFGIAKAGEKTTETSPGHIKGKPSYMAPEQIHRGTDIDCRIDIYAMGAVHHELLTMKAMREGTTDGQILFEVAKGSFPTFESLSVDVSVALSDVIYRALEPDPDKRWQTAHDFAQALESAAGGLGLRVSFR